MNFLKDLSNRLPSWHMDFEGQRRAETTYQVILAMFGLAGFAWGYVCQQFSQAVCILAAGFVLSAVLTLPPWPVYRRNPLKWLPVARPDAGDSGGGGGGGSGGGGRGKASKKDK